METLPAQFSQALGRIEVNSTKATRAQEAHREVRAVLEANPLLREWGVDTILIGSYSRRTGIYPGKDVDVFSKLTALDMSTSTELVFGQVCSILLDEYGDRAVPQNRSVKIAFSDDGFSVDVVPAVRSRPQWAIPSGDRKKWGRPEGWLETNPEGLGILTTERNRAPAVSGQGAYVPVVKLIRQTREAHLGERKPGGLYFEMATYWAFDAGISGESFAELFAASLTSIAAHLGQAAVSPLIDPAMMEPYSPQPDAADLSAALDAVTHLASEANRALTLPLCPAAVVWRRILGMNGRGACFPLPPNCDEKGRSISGVTENTDRGSDEARPFG